MISPLRQQLTACCLLVVMGSGLGSRLIAAAWIDNLAYGSMILTGLLTWRQFGLREVYLVSTSVILLACGWFYLAAPEAAMIAALDQAVFLISFVLLVSLLHEAASTSPSIALCGGYLTLQPPGRRYFALYNGVGIMAILFNIGLLSLLVPLVQRGIEILSPGDPLNAIRRQRQISALLRGFACSVIWSPTALAPLALMELIPNVERGRWIAVGFCFYLVIMILGWAEDRWRFRAYHGRAREVPIFPVAAFLRFMLVCGWLGGLTLLVMWVSGDTIVFGLMVSCPLILFGWVVLQNGFSASGRAESRHRLATILFERVAMSAVIGVGLAASGFIGRMGAAFIPAQQWTAILGLDSIPDYLFLTALPVLITALSLLALSPIVMAIFFGSLLGGLPELPADPTWVALAISCGWALSMTFSPFSTVVLLIARVGGINGFDMTIRWNGVYTLLAAVALLPLFWLLTGGH